MDFADFDSVLRQGGQRVLRLFKFHGKVAGVVIHAEVFGQARVARMFAAQLVEKADGFAAVFQQAKRFRFEAEMQLAFGALAQLRDVLDAAPEIFADGNFHLTGAPVSDPAGRC